MTEAVQMDPNVWGPPLWDLLFVIAFRSSDTDKMVQLFGLMERVIPCQHCRRSYSVYMKQCRLSRIQADRPDSAAAWLWTMHDMVNQKLGKIAINFDMIKKRHASLMPLSNDLLAIDLFAMMAFVVKETHLISFISTVAELLRPLPGFRFGVIWDAASKDPLMERLYAAHLIASRDTGLSDQTIEAFRERLALGYA